MILIEECADRCYAMLAGECTCLTDIEDCGNTCPYYKPKGCSDWVRVERNGKAELYAPEEYERKFNNEEDNRKRKLYWFIKNVPKGKGRL